jgi:hypothetical protein
MPTQTKHKINSPDHALRSIDAHSRKRPTSEQIARRRAVAIGLVILTAFGVDKLAHYVADQDQTTATITFGSNTNPTDAAMGIEALQGIVAPSNEATNNLASDIASKYMDTYPDAQVTTDLQAGGIEEPIVSQNSSVNISIHKGDYPQNIYYDVASHSLTNENGPGEVQISFPKK